MATTELTPPAAAWRLLRTLIVLEIALIAAGIAAALMQEPFLPAPLRQYEQARAAADLTTRDALFLVLGITFLVLVCAAWIALWCGRRYGRRLYTASWALGLAFGLTGSPSVTTAPVDTPPHGRHAGRRAHFGAALLLGLTPRLRAS